MAMEDKVLGTVLIATALAILSYYTMWILIIPFVDLDHPIQAYFPDRYYAVAVPVVCLVVALTAITSMIALVMIKSGGSKKTSATNTSLSSQETKKTQ